MMYIVYLIVVALLGLVIYAALVRRGYVPLLGPGVVLLGIAGIGILRLLPTDGEETTMRTYIALGMLWIGWLGLCALIAQLITRRASETAPLPAMAGAVATLAPVAGFLIVKVLS